MATVDKNFRVKNGLVVEGTTATVNGSNVLTEASTTFLDNYVKDAAGGLLENATLQNIQITYDDVTNALAITAENGVADSTTDDLSEGSLNLYYTSERAQDDAAALFTTGSHNGIEFSYDDVNNVIVATVTGASVPTFSTGIVFEGSTADEFETTFSITDPTADRTITFKDESGTVAYTQDITDAVNAIDTDDIEEGTTNLYFTDARARDAVSGGNGITYNSTTGAFEIDDAVVVTETDLDAHTDATSGVHGVTGNVVGTTDAQTISNKTLGSDLNANSNKITNLATPTASGDAANKGYVDSVAEGLHVHASVAAATDEPLADTISGTVLYNNGAGTLTLSSALTSLDGVTLTDGMRILVKDEEGVNGAGVVANGIYTWATGGTVLTRAEDYDTAAEIQGGDFVFVTGGTKYNSTGWIQIDPVTTLGTDPIEWVQFSGAGTYTAGTNLTLTGTEFSLNDSITLTSVTANLTGDVSGNVTGNLTGDVTGTVSSIANHDTDDLAEGTTNLYFTDQRAVDALEAVVPNFTEVDINTVATQVAATANLSTTNATAVYTFAKADYRTAKFLVKAAYGVHTEVSEILLTLDTSDNIAITEYAIVTTDGSLISVTAGINGANVEILATAVTANTDVTVAGTLIA